MTVLVQADGVRAVSSGSMTTAAPTSSGPKMSYTDRSKPIEDTESTLSDGPSLIRSLTASTVLSTAWWRMTTPFGSPVDPEVKMT